MNAELRTMKMPNLRPSRRLGDLSALTTCTRTSFSALRPGFSFFCVEEPAHSIKGGG